MDFAGRMQREVSELHRFFEHWFNGSLAKTDQQFARLRRSWQEPFALRDPSGELLSATRLVDEVHSQHGAFPGLRIEVGEFKVSTPTDGPPGLVGYEERHSDGNAIDRRLCVARFIEDDAAPNGVRWISLDETRTGESSGAP